MKRVRHLIGLLVFYAALWSFSSAAAWELQTSFEVPSPAALSRASYLSVSSDTTTKVTDSTCTYTIRAIYDPETNQPILDGLSNLEVVVGIMDQTYPDTVTYVEDANGELIPQYTPVADMLYHPPVLESITDENGRLYWRFPYTFRMVAKYAIIFYPLDDNNTRIKNANGNDISVSVTTNVSLNPQSNTTALERKVASIINNLLETNNDSYSIALAINDMLVRHCSYDNAHIHYDPYDFLSSLTISDNGITGNGIGTCNTYARTFALLMDAANQTCERVIGYQRSTGEQHAWNLALLDGEWYQIDATWNDPSSGPTHLYFGLTNELMLVDHSFRFMAGGGAVRTCSSLDCNYYVRSGAWQTCAAATIAALQDQIDSGFTRLSTLLKTTAGTDFNLLTEMQAQVFGTIFAREMPNYLWYHTASGTPVQVSLSYTYYGQVSGVQKGEFTGTYTRENEMTLPSGVTAIEEEAFAGVTAARYLTVPESCTAIGARAFAESGFWCVYLPAELTDIAADAFEDAPYLRVLAPSGSAAAAKLRTLNVHMATY